MMPMVVSVSDGVWFKDVQDVMIFFLVTVYYWTIARLERSCFTQKEVWQPNTVSTDRNKQQNLKYGFIKYKVYVDDPKVYSMNRMTGVIYFIL